MTSVVGVSSKMQYEAILNAMVYYNLLPLYSTQAVNVFGNQVRESSGSFSLCLVIDIKIVVVVTPVYS